jgi:hypothetical protein
MREKAGVGTEPFVQAFCADARALKKKISFILFCARIGAGTADALQAIPAGYCAGFFCFGRKAANGRFMAPEHSRL